MFKNQANQRIEVFAFDYTTGAPKTGISANIAIFVGKDFAAIAALGNTTVSEISSANAPGVYLSGLMTAAESNADHLLFTGNASTVANVAIVPRMVETFPIRFTSMVIDAAGLADATVVKLGPSGAATAQTAKDVGSLLIAAGIVQSNLMQANSVALFSGNTAVPQLGIIRQGVGTAASAANFTIDAAATFANGTLAGAVIAVTGSNQGYSQQRQITDNGLANLVVTVDPPWSVVPGGTLTYVIFAVPPAANNSPASVNVTQFGGVAGTFSGGRPEVNTTQVGGTSQTGRDLGASVLLSSGTGTGQVSLSSGKVSLAAAQTFDMTGNVSGSIGSVTGNVGGSLVGNVQGNVAGSVATLTAVSANGITGASLASSANTAIYAAVAQASMDGTTTLEQSVRLQNAVLAGKASGLGTTTAIYRNLADSKDRITATVDTDGNRTAVTRDAS